MQPEAPPSETAQNRRTQTIRFIDSMPRPLLLVFLLFAAAGIGLVVWLLTNPPDRTGRALELRRSPPTGAFTHDVLEAKLVDIPSRLPTFRPPCPEIAGLVIEGGPPAVARLVAGSGAPLQALCPLALPRSGATPELQQAVRSLATARIRFALFTRTGDFSTADLSSRRILIAVALSRTDLDPRVIAPLLAHEGFHLSHGVPVTATQEFHARVAELDACRLIVPADEFPRGCTEADAIVRLGEKRAVELLVRAGFPR